MAIIKNKAKLVIIVIVGVLSFVTLIIYLYFIKQFLSGRLPRSADDIGDRYSAYVIPPQKVNKIEPPNNIINNDVREQEK